MASDETGPSGNQNVSLFPVRGVRANDQWCPFRIGGKGSQVVSLYLNCNSVTEICRTSETESHHENTKKFGE